MKAMQRKLELAEQFERELVMQFRGRFNLSTDWTDLDVLAYAQHHGAPTRLLDWSRNPIVGLWFAISDATHEASDGVVFQLAIDPDSQLFMPMARIGIAGAKKLEPFDQCACGKPIHVLPCPPRVDRSERQDSIFTAAKLAGGWADKPLNCQETERELAAFTVRASLKPELRRLLVDLGLDAYAMYGDPDSFGKAVAARWDLTGYEFPPSSETTTS